MKSINLFQTGVISPQILVNGKNPPPQTDLRIIGPQTDHHDTPMFTDLDEPRNRLNRSNRSSSESTVVTFVPLERGISNFNSRPNSSLGLTTQEEENVNEWTRDGRRNTTPC